MSLVAELPSIVRVQPTQCIDGILFYEGEYNGWFEAEYTANPEPWDYSKRAGEMFRIRFAAEKVRACNAAPENLLELGCSRGLMTERLLTFARNLYAADISATALKTCKARCDAGAKEYGCQITYLGTTAGNLPLTDSSLDLVTICDGLYGWWLSDEQKRRALVDVHRVLKQGGHVVLSDCLMNGEQRWRGRERDSVSPRHGPPIVDSSICRCLPSTKKKRCSEGTAP